MDVDDRSYFASEWRTAQAITLTIPDLVTAAKQELSFLARVNQEPALTRAGPALNRAVRRYEFCWLPLLANQERGSAYVPPLDCAWIWHCHRLNPVRYAHDCRAVFGRVLPAPVPQARLMVAATEATIELWKKRYPNMPYHHHGLTDASFGKVGTSRRRLSYNLVEAAIRQSSFYYQVSQLHFRQEAFLHAAAMRYKGFLHIASKARGKLFLVPTYDIDVMWHAHQLDPVAYRIDMLRIVGKVLNHDDAGAGSKLSNCFQETKQLWEETYSLPFEKAGAVWRGEPQTALELEQLSSRELLSARRVTSGAYKAEQEAQYGYLINRECVQIRLDVLGARNVPLVKRPGAKVFVRMRAMRKGGSFEIRTPEVEITQQPRWRQGSWTFSFEATVDGVVLELRMRKSCVLAAGFTEKKASTLLGEAHIPFSMLMASPTLSALDWLSLHKQDQIWDLHKKPPALEIAASITPAVPAPYLFRAVNSKSTDDNFRGVTGRWRHLHTGRWLTRTVLDHRQNGIYTVRIRKLKLECRKTGAKELVPVAENERVVNIYRPNRDAKPWEATVALAATAIQLMDTKEQLERANLQRQWALFDPNTIFTVKKNRDPQMDEYPELTVEGAVGYPVGLVTGRWLQYEVHNRHPEEERGFVTVVRYTPECPTGKATALFNWKSAAFEVTPGENAVFVLLLSTVTTLAVHDLLGTMSTRPTKVTKVSTLPNEAEWGAVIMESGFRGQVEAGGFCSTNRFWWTMESQVWAREMYKSASAGAGACGGGV